MHMYKTDSLFQKYPPFVIQPGKEIFWSEVVRIGHPVAVRPQQVWFICIHQFMQFWNCLSLHTKSKITTPHINITLSPTNLLINIHLQKESCKALDIHCLSNYSLNRHVVSTNRQLRSQETRYHRRNLVYASYWQIMEIRMTIRQMHCFLVTGFLFWGISKFGWHCPIPGYKIMFEFGSKWPEIRVKGLHVLYLCTYMYVNVHVNLV